MGRASKSIITNSMAIALSTMCGYVFNNLVDREFSPGTRWLQFILTLIVTILAAIASYTVIYKITGYVPMGPADE